MSNARNISRLPQLGTGNASLMKNRIINGDMRIDQRNAGASVTPTDGQYLVDRWRLAVSQTSKFTSQQNQGSVTPPVGFVNYLGFTSSSAYSIGSSDYFLASQTIEGYNIADLNWGTADAKTVTVSFWVRSSLIGTFGGQLENQAGSRTYPFSYTISSANTWEQKTLSITGDTTGTWLTTNGAGIVFRFSLGTGSGYCGTANAWSNNRYFAPTGAVNVVSTSGATWYVTGVQLEVGSQATGYEYRQYGQELALCQRYYFKNASSSVGDAALGFGAQTSGTSSAIFMTLPVPMRSAPTLAISNTLVSDNTNFDATANSIDAGYFASSSGYANINHVSYGSANRPAFFRAKSTGSVGFVSFSAEL